MNPKLRIKTIKYPNLKSTKSILIRLLMSTMSPGPWLWSVIQTIQEKIENNSTIQKNPCHPSVQHKALVLKISKPLLPSRSLKRRMSTSPVLMKLKCLSLPSTPKRVRFHKPNLKNHIRQTLNVPILSHPLLQSIPSLLIKLIWTKQMRIKVKVIKQFLGILQG